MGPGQPARVEAIRALLDRPVSLEPSPDLLARFEAVQARDGFPCPDTGQTHCRACHGVDGDPDGPSCGHTAGCPEC